MAHFLDYDGKNFIRSQNIKVFPCAHRGYYDSGATPSALVFDPEARATTEANFVNSFHKLSNNKESYVISWDTSSKLLKCVIGGYYFEISNHTILDDWFDITIDPETTVKTYIPKYLCIKTANESLVTSLTADGGVIETRETPVLTSFTTTDKYLDILRTPDSTDYLFTGLIVCSKDTYESAKENYTAALAPFIAAPSASGDGTAVWEINPAALPITELLDTGNGRYSLTMSSDLAKTTGGNTYSNSTTALGDYSVALGKNTAASGFSSVALGDSTKAYGEGSFSTGRNTTAGDAEDSTTGVGAVAVGSGAVASGNYAIAGGNSTTSSGEGSVAFGNTTTASQKGAVALGTNTNAEAENQVVIGKYNEVDADQAFIIGNGLNSSQPNNIFTVNYTGDLSLTGNISAQGNLEAKNSIKVTAVGDSETNITNSLELGTTAANSSGEIKVYGTAEGEDPVFKVTNAGTTAIKGNTTINGVAIITKDDAVDPAVANTGALRVVGGANITKNLHVGTTLTTGEDATFGGDVSIGQKATINGALEVATSTTLKSTLEVSGKTTLGADTTTETIINGPIQAKSTIAITEKATSASTSTEDEDTTLTTKDYVDNKHDAAIAKITEKINELDVVNPAVTNPTDENLGTGSYIQTIIQTDGKISATKFGFATNVASNNDQNAPTAKAVTTYVTDSIAKIWTEEKVKKTADASTFSSLKSIILDAAYPIGSIYTCYAAGLAKEFTCPIADSLGGTWTAITEGQFLRSVGDAFALAGTTGGSANAVLISHTHEFDGSFSCEAAGEHSHQVTVYASKTGKDAYTGFEGNAGDIKSDTKKVMCNSDTFANHTHTISTPEGVTTVGVKADGNSSTEQTGTDANLPPYVYVYMWRRTE